MNESPSANAILSGREMPMKEVTRKEIAIHHPRMGNHHVAGAVCRRNGVSFGKRIILETKFEDCIKGGAIRKVLKRPNGEVR